MTSTATPQFCHQNEIVICLFGSLKKRGFGKPHPSISCWAMITICSSMISKRDSHWHPYAHLHVSTRACESYASAMHYQYKTPIAKFPIPRLYGHGLD